MMVQHYTNMSQIQKLNGQSYSGMASLSLQKNKTGKNFYPVEHHHLKVDS